MLSKKPYLYLTISDYKCNLSIKEKGTPDFDAILPFYLPVF